MTSHDHDLPFLQELARRLDEDPRADVSGRDLATHLGIDDTAAKQVLARLIRQDLAERRNAPARFGDGPLDGPLEVTSDGWTAATTGQL